MKMKFRQKKFVNKSKGKGLKQSGEQQDWEEQWDEKSKTNDLNQKENVTKWYEEFADTPERIKDLTSEEIATFKEEASQVLKDETTFYLTSVAKRKQGSDQAWIKTVLQKGTASDKVAAHILKIQESPVFNLSSLITLINMVRVSKKEFSFVIDALAELFITDLLPPNLKLRQFEKQPLDRLSELSSGNAMSRRKRLSYWAFEDELKKLYLQMIHSINIIAKDSVEANKEKAVSVLYKLLASHPEQEDVLLNMLVNKFGDPSRKVVSKIIYSLTQLLRVHEGMKQVVMNEVERLLFRSNINAKTQYYAICFLSQFNFTINDDLVACNIISIYFSFFKACVKKGDINSRMLGSLLMGLNRAYPYAKKKLDTLSDHINTLYKLVHLGNFNISLQCLSILFQISDASEDRFYCALYKKLSDLNLAMSAHQAMFINLLYRALTKDSNTGRIKTFIKRIFQLCSLMPVPLTCGLLYLVSQLINKRKILSSNELHIHPLAEKYGDDDDDDDEEEHYVDVDKGIKEDSETKNEVIKDEEIGSTLVNNADSDIKNENDDSPVKSEKERKPCASWCHSVFQRKKHGFDPLVRNPAFAEGESAVYTELTLLTRHFHPTVALFASNILENRVITYTGDPLVDFTLVRFIERFVFKNPKKITPGAEAKGPDPVLAQRKYYTPSGAKALPTNSRLYLEQNEKDVPIDELFLYRYLHQRQQLGYRMTKKEEGEDDNSDADSVASEEFEEMLNNMMKKKGDIDFADDVGDNLSKKTSKKSKRRQDIDDDSDEEDDGEDIEEEEEEEEEDFDDEEEIKEDKRHRNLDDNVDFDDESDIDLEGIDDSDAEVMDFDESGDDDIVDDQSKQKKSKKGSKVNLKKLKGDISDLFAPAEEFSEMLEEAGTSRYKLGTAQTLSNKDKAVKKELPTMKTMNNIHKEEHPNIEFKATKQLQWEMKRNDNWMNEKKRKKQHMVKNGKKRKTKY